MTRLREEVKKRLDTKSVKEKISKYQLNIEITSRALKNNLIEINTILKFEDKEDTVTVTLIKCLITLTRLYKNKEKHSGGKSGFLPSFLSSHPRKNSLKL